MVRIDILFKTDSSKLPQVAEPYKLDLIVVFGSYAKGKAQPDDLDIAVRTTREEFARLSSGEGLWEWELSLLADLDRIIDLPYDIDLVLLNRVFDSTLLFEIARYGIPIYEKEPTTFHHFRSYAARRFDDDAKFRRLGWEYLKRWCSDDKSAL